ncbi:MAG: EAL domain-containing protein [Gammaproteobacteria bacterium]
MDDTRDNSIIADPARLAALRGTGLLDTHPQESYDRLTRLAATLLNAPGALVTLIDEQRQFFKSQVGLPKTSGVFHESPLTHGLCPCVVKSGAPLIIKDARKLAAYRDNPAVRESGVVSYVGIPLVSEGHNIGAFCVFDTRPRLWNKTQIAILSTLAASVTTEIELRRIAREAERMEWRLRNLVEDINAVVWEADAKTWQLSYINRYIEDMLGYPTQAWLADANFWSEHVHPEDRERVVSYRKKAIQAGQDHEFDYRIIAADGRIVWLHASIHIVTDESGQACLLHGVTTNITVRKQAEEALLESRKRFQQLADAMPQIVWTARPDGYVDYYNKRWYEYTGLLPGEGGDQSWKPILHPDDLQPCLDTWYRAVESGEPYQIEYRFKEHATGDYRWHLGHALPIKDNAGNIVQWLGTSTDIDKLKRGEEALRISEERYALAAQGANDGLWDWHLAKDEIYLSARWKSMLGYQEYEIGNRPDDWFKLIHPEDLTLFKTTLAAHLNGHKPQFESEHRMLHKDGTYRWMLSCGRATFTANGQPSRMAGSQSDIHDTKIAAEQLALQAFYDPLTKLPNRALLTDRLTQMVERTKRNKDFLFGILFLDLDRFKFINDNLGHILGDQLLVDIAQRLHSCIRPEDTVARLAGDEFVIVLDAVKGVHELLHAAQRIHQVMEQPFYLAEQEIHSSASIGILLSNPRYERPQEMLRDADVAMYRAKALGTGHHMVFTRDMLQRQPMDMWELEIDLRRAIERHEFCIHYQPIISLKTDKIIGVEALARWQHPQRGLILPNDFISLAEETGLIKNIGERLLRQACAQVKSWQSDGYLDLHVAINCSALQFQDEHLAELIQSVLAETGLATNCLKLEITESLAMKNIDFSIATLNKLNNMGVQLSIDDFGTGYSSLAYLSRFPINTVKIDQSFIRGIAYRGEAAITAAIIAMSHSLNLTVIAEGVETEQQLSILRAQDCDSIQGYLVSGPLPPEELAEFLSVKHQKNS